MTAKNNPTPSDGRRILIADDEREIREMLELLLATRLSEYPIDVVVNGAEAVHAFQEVYYRAVVLDIRMPVKDGGEAFGEVKKICETNGWEMPAFVFCTGFDPTPEVEAIVAGDSRHCLLRKPLDSDELVEILRARLEAAEGDES